MEPEGTAWPARAVYPGLELERSGVTGVKMGGHFVVFNQWTRIDSIFEGTFMERIARGAFTKTFKERGDRIKVPIPTRLRSLHRRQTLGQDHRIGRR
jgi:hypothetical protein